MGFTTQILQDDVRILRFTLGGGVFDGEIFLEGFRHWQVVNLLTDTVDSETVGRMLAAERIILDTGFHTAEEFRDAFVAGGILDVFESVQERGKIVLPTYSLQELAVSGEIPFWESERRHQENVILNWSGLFPDATLVLLLDVITPSGAQLALFYQSISDGVIYAPDVSGGLLSVQEAAEALQNEIFRPNDGSVVLQAQPCHFPSAAKEAAELYRSMFNTDLQVQSVGVRQSSPIPFSVRISEIRSSPQAHAHKIVSILPAPAEFSTMASHQEYWSARQAEVESLSPVFQDEDQALPEPQMEVALPVEVVSSLEESPDVIKPPDLIESPPSLPEEESAQEDALVSEPVSTPVLNQPAPPPPRYPLPVVNTKSVTEKIQEKSIDQLSSDVKRIFRSNITQTKVETTEKKVVARKKIKKQSKKRRALFYIGIVFVSVGMGLGALLGWFKVSVDRAQAELSRVIADSTITSSKAQVSWGSYKTQVAMLKPLYAFFDSILALGVIDSAGDLIQTEDKLAALEKSTLTANQSLISVFKAVWRMDAGSVAELSKTVATDLSSHQQILGEFQQVAQIGGEEHILGLSTNSSPEKTTALVEQIAPKLGDIFGINESKNYVVVLQNSQELRSTGGFIEAVALLSFANGSLSGVETYSSYQLDSRMQTHIAPPEDLQQILGEQQWWLRDANWYPDGPKTADQIARFAHSTIGKQPDGVIILNTLSLPAILAATGPIEMPEFNEVLTDKNIAERLEHHTELPHQISESKVEYRGALLKALFAKLGNLSDEQTLAFLRVIHQELDGRQLLLYSANATIQQTFAQFGWVGSFAFPSCPAPFNEHHCETDGLAQVETNVGVNRANAYIERQLTHEIELTTTSANHTHTIAWENRAQTPAWPKGDYRVYLRLYVPRQVSGITATLNGNPVAQQEIRRVSTQNTEEIGLVVVVPIKEKATLVVSYSTPLSLSQDPASYLFYQVRQPGTTTNLAPVTIRHPEGWHVATVAPEPESLSPALVFGSESAPHTVQIVQFTQAK